jgi:rubrerythrin
MGVEDGTMVSQRTIDILEYLKDFHRQISAFYSRLSNEAEKERMKMLLDYMSRHEQHMAEYLTDYEQEAAKKVLNTWFKYNVSHDARQCIENVKIAPEMSLEEVIRISLEFDRCLVGLYRELADQAVSQDVKNLFLDLLEMEKKEEIKCIRDALLFEQI